MRILIGKTRIDFPPLPPSEDQRAEQEIARDVARFLLARLRSRKRTNPDRWASLGTRLGCRIVPFYAPGKGMGEYAPWRGKSGGVITYNVAATRLMQARTLIHEISHHVLAARGVVEWDEAANFERGLSTCSFDGPDNSRAHRIARKVEKIVLG